MARHLSLGRTFGIFVPLSNPHFAAVDDPLAIYEYLVWHGFRLQLPGGDQIRSSFCTGQTKWLVSCFEVVFFFLPAKTIYIYIYIFFLLRGGLDDFFTQFRPNIGEEMIQLETCANRWWLNRPPIHNIYDLSLENYKVGVFNS